MISNIRKSILLSIGMAVASQALAAGPAGYGQKPGLWHVRKTVVVTPAPAYPPQPMGGLVCLGAYAGDAMIDQLINTGRNGHGVTCSKHDIHLRPDGVTVDWVCSQNGNNASTHGEITEPSAEAFRETTTSDHMTEGFKTTGTIDGKWLGECPSGMRVGEMRMDAQPGDKTP